MAYKSREDMVGKRFLAVYNTSCKLKLSKIAEWEWRAGIVRSVSTKDQNSGNLSVRMFVLFMMQSSLLSNG